MSRPLRVGVIGAGAVADAHHLPGYDHAADAEVVAIADVNLDRAEAMAKKWSVPIVCDDFRELLRRDEVDAVSICTPSALHEPHALAAVAAGKHVLCEAPLSLGVRECRELMVAAREHGVILMPALPYRFHACVLRARELLAEGFIGRPFLFRARHVHDGPYVSWSAVSDWYYDPEQAGGGCLLDLGQHLVDLFRVFVGEVRAVSADVATLSKDIPLEDHAVCLLHGDGARGQIDASWCTKDPGVWVEIHGASGILAMDFDTPLRLFTPDAGWQVIGDARNGGAAALAAHFVDCCLKGGPLAVTPADGLQAIRVIRAAYESARSGRRVALPD